MLVVFHVSLFYSVLLFAMAGNHDVGRPIHTERHVRIICIGAGASGLLFAYKLQRSFSNFSLVIYEKNPEVAGTWWENRYPGYVRSPGMFI